MGDFLLAFHHIIRSLSSGRSTPVALAQNPCCAVQLHAGRGVIHVPIGFCIARLLVFCLFKNLRISSYLHISEDGKNALGSNTNSWELGQSNTI